MRARRAGAEGREALSYPAPGASVLSSQLESVTFTITVNVTSVSRFCTIMRAGDFSKRDRSYFTAPSYLYVYTDVYMCMWE